MYQDLLGTAVRGARSGAEVLRRYFRRGGLEVRAKGTHDLVSLADHESEARIIAEIQGAFPDHLILAEESGRRGESSRYEWLIDPLDGTSNFLQGLPVFCVSVACRHRGEVVAGAVLDPVGENLFTATRGGGARWNDSEMRVSGRCLEPASFLVRANCVAAPILGPKSKPSPVSEAKAEMQ